MDIHSIRQQLNTKNIYDIPLRVTFYARVSTEKDDQINSLNNQISYYREFISKNSNWIFVEGYIDEGLSGMTVKNRENFHRMVDDAKQGKFDLIITKEISRFARNTVDSIQYTRNLMGFGVAVFFQNDAINTVDEDSELRLTIMSGIAQDELRKLSSRIKFGHQEAIKKGVVLGNSRMIGYDKDKGKLIINEKEAVMVRQLFEFYATGEYSLKQLENLFWDMGYRNNNGNKINHNTMSNMLNNPKYKGYYVGNKVKIIDMFTKQQKFLPESEWHVFKDETGELVPAIVSEEIWDKANEIWKVRSRAVKDRKTSYKHENLFTGKLICSEHNVPYYRKECRDKSGNDNSQWRCSHKINNGAKSCQSITIYEKEMVDIIYHVIREVQSDMDSVVDKFIQYHNEQNCDSKIIGDISRVIKDMDLINSKKEKLLEYNLDGKIEDKEFIKRNDEYNITLTELAESLTSLENKKESQTNFIKDISKLKKTLKSISGKSSLNKQTIDALIDKLYVTPINDTTMNLDIAFKTASTSTILYTRHKSRSGNMLLTIWPPTEPACLEVKSPL